MEYDELIPDVIKINKKLKKIVNKELEKEKVPSKELLDTIQLIFIISKGINLTFED